MATYDLEEQEQLDELKTWWTMYGNLVTGILVAVALAVAGWQGWNWWQRQQAVQASAVYSSLQTAAAQRDAKRARELAGELIDKYSLTAYAGIACRARAGRRG
jgi:predicted negative regulator of RcsB-dependent stress response